MTADQLRRDRWFTRISLSLLVVLIAVALGYTIVADQQARDARAATDAARVQAELAIVDDLRALQECIVRLVVIATGPDDVTPATYEEACPPIPDLRIPPAEPAEEPTAEPTATPTPTPTGQTSLQGGRVVIDPPDRAPRPVAPAAPDPAPPDPPADARPGNRPAHAGGPGRPDSPPGRDR